MKATQDQLDAKHQKAIEYIQLYVDGLITLPEFSKAVSGLTQDMSQESYLDLIDPETGLRFI